MMFTNKTAVGATLAALILTLLSVAGDPLQAQPTLTVRAHVAVGVLLAQNELPNAPILSSLTNVLRFRTFQAAPALSGGLELGVSNVPASLRLKATTSLNTKEVGVWGCAPDSLGNPTPCPSILIEVLTDVRATAATADIVGMLEVGPLVLQPLVGVGWMRYSYSWDPAAVGSFSLEPGTVDFDSVVAHYGVAVGIPVGRIHVETEFAAYRASADPGRPNGVRSASLGLSVPIR